MPSIFRNLHVQWHRLLNTKKINIDGLIISTDPMLIPKSIRSMLFKNVYEKHERDLVKKYLGNNDRVLEIGTGIGLVSLVVNKICGENNVVSYEANPDMETIILQNFELNNITPNLKMRAITKSGSDIEFYKDEGILSSSSIDRKNQSKKCIVESDALEDVLASFNPNWIVMDVEGAEIELLGGDTIKDLTGLIVELHPHIVGQKKIDDLINHLRQLGFSKVDEIHKTFVFIK